jgi:very-short-patch-repair endonuclease
MCNLDFFEKFSKAMLKRNKGVALMVNLAAQEKQDILNAYYRTKAKYSKVMFANMRQFVAGNVSMDEYLSKQKNIIRSCYTDSFSLGKYFGSGGALLTSDEKNFITFQTTQEMKFMENFANDIMSRKGKMPYARRMRMYIDGLDGMFGFGKLVYLPEEVQIYWMLGRTDKHCIDCLMFSSKNPYTKKTLPGFPKSGQSRCFVGKYNMYNIFTMDGWKNFKDIKIGDQVLSHRGKWKKVLAIIDEPVQDEYCYEVVFESKNKRRMVVYMLNDHKSIVEKRWTRADELNVGDNVLFVGHKCKVCGKTIKYDDKRGINFEFCSQACGSKGVDKWKKGRESLIAKYGKLGHGLDNYRDDPINAAVSAEIGKRALAKVHASRIGKTYEEMYGKEKADMLRLKCPEKAHKKTRQLVKDGEHPFQKMYSKMSDYERKEFARIARKQLSHSEFLRLLNERIQNDIKMGVFKFSSPEKAMVNILNEMDLKWETQILIDGRFFDFYLPDYEVYIEVDGDFIHANPEFYSQESLKKIQKKQKRIDNLKNEIMKQRNLTLIRFWENDINNNKEKVINKLNLLLNNHSGSFVGYYRKIAKVTKIKTKDMMGNRMLSLTVEGDESYVANHGLIAHNCLSNCRCALSYVFPSNRSKNDYDDYILKNHAENKNVPTEDEYNVMMGHSDDYYYNRLMYEITKDKTFMAVAGSSLQSLKTFQLSNNFKVTQLPVATAIKDVRQMNKLSSFGLVEDVTELNANEFVSFFSNGELRYGKVTKVLNSAVSVRTIENVTYDIVQGKAIIFREVK